MLNIHGELQLRRVIFEVRFQPSLKYYDEINEIGALLNQTYPYWQRDWTKIQFMDRVNHTSLIVEHNRIGGHIDVPNDFYHFKRRMLESIKVYNEKIQISNIRRSGLRCLWLCPVDFDFNELLKIIQDKFYAPKEELNEVIGNQFNDIAYMFYFEKEGYNVHLRMGPVTKDEIPHWIPPQGPAHREPDDDENLKLGNGVDKYISNQAVESHNLDNEMTDTAYPEVAIFYDVDCYTEKLKINDMETFLDKGYGIARSVANGITKYLMEV